MKKNKATCTHRPTTNSELIIRVKTKISCERARAMKRHEGRSHDAICAADAVLVASGTATLEVALFKKPMVIAYKVMAASWQLMRHMGYQPWIGLPNILAREFVVPELLQHAATPRALADAVWTQLSDAPNRLRLVQRFTDMHHSLLRNSAQESAAAVMRIIQASPSS